MSEYLYHYTDESGMEGIRGSKRIQMSTDTNRDAILGEGVYLTDLPPSTDDEELLKNNYGAARHGQGHKITCYIKIRKSDLSGIQRKRFGDRVIYVYNRPLNLSNISVSFGKKNESGSWWSWCNII